MITEFEIDDYGPIKHVKSALTPLHAFVGPNDSGKSSLLRALLLGLRPNEVDWWPVRGQKAVTKLHFTGGGQKAAFFNSARMTLPANLGGVTRAEGSMSSGQDSGPANIAVAPWGRAELIRFDPDALRRSSGLTTEEGAGDYLQKRGEGLPAAYDVLLNRHDGSFEQIEERFCELFPTVAHLRLVNVPPAEKRVAITLQGGEILDAERMSEGMLYYLAFSALQYLRPVDLVAIEEPENGLHPSRIAEVVSVLRSFSMRSQVVIATHSPLVINELKADEISIVTRTAEHGTRITPMKETADFESRSRVYELGELWLSYANGTDEGPLLNGGPGPRGGNPA